MTNNRWRCLRWGLLVLGLAGLTWALYAWLPPAPRWVLHGVLSQGFTPDGQSFRTVALPGPIGTTGMQGPVQVWDVGTGQETNRMFADAPRIAQIRVAADGRRTLIVTAPEDRQTTRWLRSVDMVTAVEHNVRLPDVSEDWELDVSPGGGLVCVNHAQTPRHRTGVLAATRITARRFYLFEAATLKMLAEVEADDSHWQWAKNEDAFLVYVTEANKARSTLRRISQTADTLARLDGARTCLGFTPDGKILLTQGMAADDSGRTSTLVWDVAGLGRPGNMPRQIPLEVSTGTSPELLADSRTMVFTKIASGNGRSLRVWDLIDHRLLGEIQHTAPEIAGGCFGFDRDLFAYTSEAGKTARLTVCRARPPALLWEREWPLQEIRRLDYLEGTNTLFTRLEHEGSDPVLVVTDVAGGATRLTVRVPQGGGFATLTSKGTLLAVDNPVNNNTRQPGLISEVLQWLRERLVREARDDQWTTTTRVFDLASGAQVFEARTPDLAQADLSLDGRSLILAYGNNDSGGGSIICYDLPMRRRWLAIVGIPPVIGIMLVLIQTGWRRWRWLRGKSEYRNPKPVTKPKSEIRMTETT